MILVAIFYHKEGTLLKIHADGDEKISVLLTKTDLTDLDITYDELDYSNIETRRVIWTILDKANKVLETPVNIDNRLLIQVSPADDGGCRMDFTQLPEPADPKRKRLIMKKDAEPILFCAFDENAFLDCIKLLKDQLSCVKELKLYLYENMYYVLLYPKITASDRLLFCLNEFGEALASPKTRIAEISEYGKALS